ncbi:MAG TPA: NAD(P)/FAD-dependent oxidoreductase [Bacteroidales bacterium]|nr:NAD(P)/FAD-dependent oxidoreductase [Bacteroidales bacterium]
MKTHEDSIIIIGAGFAGLGAGIYAQKNGYNSRIFEMHNLPGGLCTSWGRKGYTFDGCIHWLVGSSQKSGLHDLWEETGIAENRQFIDIDRYFTITDKTGRTLTFYTDVNRLEKHLLESCPGDEKPIRDFINGIRMCIPFDQPSKHDSLIVKMRKKTRLVSTFIIHGAKMKLWMNTTSADFCEGIKDPLLSRAFMEMWIPEFSMFFMLFTFAYLHNRNAGYPIGGSKPMAEALEKKYKELGGKIQFNKKVVEITTENGRATGVRLEDGTVHMAAKVISAADGYSTLFNMLGDKFGDEKSREPYKKWKAFPPLVYVSIGVNRSFEEIPVTVSGHNFNLREPVIIDGKKREWISLHIFNHDPTLAPKGKTVISVMLESDFDYWKKLASDRKTYLQKKEEIASIIIDLIDEKFPGIKSDVEVYDVATPVTFERYTGNWKGSFEGWLITPENAGVLMKPMSQTVQGLSNFYMCGQWVEPGGGLPTSIMSARRLIKRICREDGKKFRS